MNETATKSDLAIFQKQVLRWSSITFPLETPESKLAHLKREVQELSEDIDDETEMADILILLVGIAEMKGVDLLAAAKRKMCTNLGRTWSQPDEEGVYHHLTEG